MRITNAAIIYFISCHATTTLDAFIVQPLSQLVGRKTTTTTTTKTIIVSSSNTNNVDDISDRLSQFAYLLKENNVDNTEDAVMLPTIQSNRRIVLTDGNYDNTRTTVLASTATFPGAPEVVEEDIEAEGTSADDPYANALDSQLNKIQSYQEQPVKKQTFEEKFKSMDLQDIILQLVIPGIIIFAGARWTFNKVGGKVTDNADEILDNFTKEMLYHDGDLQEMELCIKDYKNKLVWMGPTRNDNMIKRYLESYSKKKTVSPQAIASLSHVFTMFKLTEEKAANIMVQLCKSMGTDKISSAGKILFFGTRILKSKEGKAALLPIKEMIMSTYREEAVAETLVESSQQAMAEAAYRTAILSAGKKQSSLTPGWEVLGLKKETATRIYEEAKKDGFVSDRETMYGGQTRKYDKQGRQIDDEGKLANPEEATSEDDDDDDELDTSGSNVFECGNCGFTLFVAQGRESKFYGSGFKCPECGAPKKDFIARNDDDE